MPNCMFSLVAVRRLVTITPGAGSQRRLDRKITAGVDRERGVDPWLVLAAMERRMKHSGKECSAPAFE